MDWNAEAQGIITRDLIKDEYRDIREDMRYLKRCLVDYPEHTKLLCTQFDAFMSSAMVSSVPTWQMDAKIGKRIHDLAYNNFCTLREAIKFLPMFISHECHDDGSPTIAWIVNPAFPEGLPKLTMENMKERSRLTYETPLQVVEDPGTYHVVRCVLLKDHLEIDGEYITTYAGGLPELRRLLAHNTYVHSTPSEVQKALCSLIGL